MSVELTVITAGCYSGDSTPLAFLRQSCERHKIPLLVYGQHLGFSNWVKMKVVMALEALELVTTPYVMYTDGADSFLLAGEREILGKYQQFLSPIVIAGERDLWPEPPEDLKYYYNRERYPIGGYPEIPGPARFANAGSWIGRVGMIRVALEYLRSLSHHVGGEENDQPLWHELICSREFDIEVDSHSRIFHTTSGGGSIGLKWRGGRLFASETVTPCVLHFNGKTPGIEEAFKEAYGAR